MSSARPLLFSVALLACEARSPADATPPNAAPPPAEVVAAPNDNVDNPAAGNSTGARAASKVETGPTAEPKVPGGGPDPLTLAAEYSTSIGSPTEGSLTGGVPLPLHGPGYRFSPIKDKEARYGTVELVAALVRSAAQVHEALPGNAVTFGDLARAAGGDIDGHGSHRSGRDVDIYFYFLGEDDNPVPGKAIPLDPDGEGTDFGDLTDPDDDTPVHLDVPRTWRFVQALLSQDDLAVGRIFVVEHIRAMLLAEAAAQQAPPDVVALFADVTCQPKAPHDDHLHVRVFCSADDIERGCEDTRPLFPWHRKRLAKAGAQAVIAKRTKKRSKKKKTKGIAQARQDAGQMHADVVTFLDRRNTWARKPTVNRPYCR